MDTIASKVGVDQTDNTLGVMAGLPDLRIIITAIYRMMIMMITIISMILMKVDHTLKVGHKEE